MKIQKIIWFLLFLLSITPGCEQEKEIQPFPASEFIATGTYAGEYWPTEGWRSCSPEEVGMNTEYLEDLNEEILILKKLHVDIHNVLIIKNGYIVAEQYYSEDYGKDSLHRIYSCTKSLVSALLGIAIDQGTIGDVTERMIDYFPEYSVENMTDAKAEITLEDLLTMSAGLEWYELDYPYGDDRNTFKAWSSSEDQVKFVLDRPMVALPGEEYSYNTGISQVLSAILQKATGTRTDSFGVENLFIPLGIDQFYWPVDKKGVAYGGNGVRLTSRDMAKFGYLYLKNGAWENDQIVPSDWVEVSSQPHVERKYIPGSYYGYHWWIGEGSSYTAVGYAGQRITVIPEHDLVVVFSNNFTEGNELQESTPDRLMRMYIMPSVE